MWLEIACDNPRFKVIDQYQTNRQVLPNLRKEVL